MQDGPQNPVMDVWDARQSVWNVMRESRNASSVLGKGLCVQVTRQSHWYGLLSMKSWWHMEVVGNHPSQLHSRKLNPLFRSLALQRRPVVILAKKLSLINIEAQYISPTQRLKANPRHHHLHQIPLQWWQAPRKLRILPRIVYPLFDNNYIVLLFRIFFFIFLQC